MCEHVEERKQKHQHQNQAKTSCQAIRHADMLMATDESQIYKRINYTNLSSSLEKSHLIPL